MSRVTLITAFESQVDKSINIIESSIETSLTRLRQEKEEEVKLNKEIAKLKQQIQSIKLANSEQGEDLKKSYSVLSKQVEASYSQLNSLQAENRGLRLKIEDMRLESSKCKHLIHSLQQDIGISTNLARNCSNSKLKEKRADSEHQNKIQKILSTSATEKRLFKQTMNRLSTELVQKKEEEIKSIRKHSEAIVEYVNRPLSAIDIEAVEQSMIKLRGNRLTHLQNKLQRYKENSLKIKEGFDNISSAFGFSSYQQVAESVIASENQIKELQAYLLNLKAETEYFVFTNNKIYSQFNKNTVSMQKPREICKNLNLELKNIERKKLKVEKKSNLITLSIDQAEKIIDKCLSTYETMLRNKSTHVLNVSEAKTLEEKLQMIEQVIHQGQLYKALIAEKYSSFGTIHSSLMPKFSASKSSIRNIKDLLETSTIPEIPDEDSALWTPITIKNNAQRMYDEMMFKKRVSIQLIARSVSPLPLSNFNK